MCFWRDSNLVLIHELNDKKLIAEMFGHFFCIRTLSAQRQTFGGEYMLLHRHFHFLMDRVRFMC